MLWSALLGEVANSVVLDCMEEAKRLVNKAYKERRERWELQTLTALGKAASSLLKKGQAMGGW